MVKKKNNNVEEHYDDCGDCIDSLRQDDAEQTLIIYENDSAITHDLLDNIHLVHRPSQNFPCCQLLHQGILRHGSERQVSCRVQFLFGDAIWRVRVWTPTLCPTTYRTKVKVGDKVAEYQSMELWEKGNAFAEIGPGRDIIAGCYALRLARAQQSTKRHFVCIQAATGSEKNNVYLVANHDFGAFRTYPHECLGGRSSEAVTLAARKEAERLVWHISVAPAVVARVE